MKVVLVLGNRWVDIEEHGLMSQRRRADIFRGKRRNLATLLAALCVRHAVSDSRTGQIVKSGGSSRKKYRPEAFASHFQ